MSSGTVETLAEEPRDSVALPRMELQRWWWEFGVVAGITTRDTDFELSDRSDGESGDRIWGALEAGFGGGFGAAALSRQVHGSKVGVVQGAPKGLHLSWGLDAHVTSLTGVLLGVTAADCVPVYIVHPVSGTIGLVHAGWRGIRDGVLEAAVRQVCETGDARPSDLVMHCGVSICGSCYEVGAEVLEAFSVGSERDRAGLDLRSLLVERAQALGLERLSVSDWCTMHHKARFHSHRGSRGRGGRMLAFLGRPNLNRR